MKNFWNTLLVIWKILTAINCALVDYVKVLFWGYIAKREDKILAVLENEYVRMDRFMEFYKTHDCKPSRYICHDLGERLSNMWLSTYDVIMVFKADLV